MTRSLRRAAVAVGMSIILASCSGDEQKTPAARAGWIDQMCVPTTANGNAPPGEPVRRRTTGTAGCGRCCRRAA